MIHDDPPDIVERCLDSLAEHCNLGVYVNCNETDPMLRKIATRHEAVRDMIYTSNGGGRWDQGRVRDATLRMVDGVKPNVVLFPDSDEVFYRGFSDDLNRFVHDDEAMSFWFNLLYNWGDMRHYRRDGLWKRIHHVRGFKWQPDLTFVPYGGYASPTNLINLEKETRFHATRPLLHLGYMREEDRERKYRRANCAPKTDDGIIIRETPEDIVPESLLDFS